MATREYLRARQGEHSLILLSAGEFAELTARRSLTLPGRHHEHFARSLRRGNDWQAIVGDGQGLITEALVSKGEIRLRENAEPLHLLSVHHNVTLAQAWVKPKALSLILTKCAEIGVTEIILFDSEHSAPHGDSMRRMAAIIENACMQAYNPVCPQIVIAAAIADLRRETTNILFGDIEAEKDLTQPTAGQSVMFINGPEGGFSTREITALRAFATGVLISENVLRAETAAIIAAGILCLPS